MYKKEDANLIVSLRKANKTVDEIAIIVNKKPSSVRSWLSRQKIYKRDNKLKIIDKLKPEELAYIAGIIDGEGSIIISKLKPRINKGERSYKYQLYLKVTNTDRRLIEYLSEKTLTNIINDRRYTNKNPNSRNTFSIHWPVEITLYLLDKVYPYLVIKKEQVDLAKSFRDTFKDFSGKGGIPKQILEKREKMYLEMKKIHKREF